MAANATKQRVISTTEDFFSLKTKWNELTKICKVGTPFLTWEWMYTWWQIYNEIDTELSILVYESADNLVGVAPFYIRSKKAYFSHRTVHFLGTGEKEEKEVSSEYLDILIHPSFSQDEIIIKQVFEYFLDRSDRCIKFEFSRVLESSTLLRYLATQSGNKLSVAKSLCGYRYCLKLPNAWNDYISSLKSTRRRSIIAALKNFDGDNKVRIKFLRDYQEIKVELKNLVNLHTKYWNHKGKKGAFYSREFCEFIERISQSFFHLKLLHVMSIKYDNYTIAVIYSFLMNDTLYYYQSGFDLVENKKSLGIYAHSENIKNSISSSIKQYDFMLGGPVSYKERYGCDKYKMYNIKIYTSRFNLVLDKVLSKLFYMAKYRV